MAVESSFRSDHLVVATYEEEDRPATFGCLGVVLVFDRSSGDATRCSVLKCSAGSDGQDCVGGDRGRLPIDVIEECEALDFF